MHLLQLIAWRTALLKCCKQSGDRMHCSLGSSFTISLMPRSLVFCHTCHQAQGRHILTQMQHWKTVIVTSSEHSAKKSRNISLNQSCRACKHAPYWCKIQRRAQPSLDQTPEEVTVTSTVSPVRCSACSSGDPQDREHWLGFFAKGNVCYNIYSNRDENPV